MYSHPDPTANRAISSAEKEWRTMARRAYRYRTDPQWNAKKTEWRCAFTGIYNRLLTEPLERLREICGYPQNR